MRALGRTGWLVGWLVATQPAMVGAVPAPGAGDCLVCHSNPELAVRIPGDPTVRSLFVAPAPFYASVHGEQACVACHTEAHFRPGDLPAPAPLPAELAAVTASRPNAQRDAINSCFRCHEKEAVEFAKSTHGRQAAAGNLDVPLCHDCHTAHTIQPAMDLESSTNPDNLASTCADCHADALLMARYQAGTAVVTTYETSFHGEKRSLGGARAAVCTSCHGVHQIQGVNDPESTINPANAPRTCGECHPGADAAFAASFKHVLPDRQTYPLVYWVGRLYMLAIFGTVGGMLVWIVLDLRRRRIGGPAGHQGGPKA